MRWRYAPAAPAAPAAVATLAAAGCATRRALSPEVLFELLGSFAHHVPALERHPFFIRAVAAEKALSRADFVPHEARPLANIDFPLQIGWGADDLQSLDRRGDDGIGAGDAG